MIVAQANNPRAQVVGTGTRNLVIGENVFYIEVTGADGKRNVYTIKITRSEQEIKEYNTRDKVFIAIKCKILDAIEEINLRVFI